MFKRTTEQSFIMFCMFNCFRNSFLCLFVFVSSAFMHCFIFFIKFLHLLIYFIRVSISNSFFIHVFICISLYLYSQNYLYIYSNYRTIYIFIHLFIFLFIFLTYQSISPSVYLLLLIQLTMPSVTRLCLINNSSKLPYCLNDINSRDHDVRQKKKIFSFYSSFFLYLFLLILYKTRHIRYGLFVQQCVCERELEGGGKIERDERRERGRERDGEKRQKERWE